MISGYLNQYWAALEHLALCIEHGRVSHDQEAAQLLFGELRCFTYIACLVRGAWQRDRHGAVGPVLERLCHLGQTVSNCKDPREQARLLADMARDGAAPPSRAGSKDSNGAASPSAGSATASPSALTAYADTVVHHAPAIAAGLGLLGILLCGIWTAAPAWALGAHEIARINKGEAPDSGRGLARAGLILGIIGTALFALRVLAHAVSL